MFLSSLKAVHGTSSVDVFSVGTQGVILHYDGNSWEIRPIISTETLMGIWGANPNELFVAGQLGVIFHEVPSTVSVELDIKPQSCPNPLNTKSKGVLPVAVLALEVSM